MHNKPKTILLGIHFWVIIGLIFMLTFSCDKETEEPGCGCIGPPKYTIEDEYATMIYVDFNFEFYIQRANGDLLGPCSAPFPDSIKINGLQIMWSGEIMGICPNQKSFALPAKFTKVEKL